MKIPALATYVAVFTAFAAPAIAEVDPCLLGSWQADDTRLAMAFQQAMEQPVSGPNALRIEAIDVSGQMVVEIAASGVITIDAYGLRFDYTAAGNPPMSVTIFGGSTGILATGDGDGSFWVAPQTSAVNAEAEFLGMVVPVPNAGSLFPATDVVGSYSCDASTLVFAPEGPPNAFPRLLTRID